MKSLPLAGSLTYMICGFVLLLGGCQRYHPHPLPIAPDLHAAPDLKVATGTFGFPELVAHQTPQNGLDEVAVMELAVGNNPGLKAVRQQAGVAEAEVFDAGLLPDPVLAAGGGKSALNYGYGLALSEDIRALLTRAAAVASARQHGKQIDLTILWQETQVAEQARELFLRMRAAEKIQQLLATSHDLLARQYRDDQAALQRGDVTLLTTSADLSVLVDSETTLRQEDLQASATGQELAALLGLQPDARLHLVGPGSVQSVSAEMLKRDVETLSQHRADLLALQAGYASQEKNVRRSILAQFPPLSATVENARDTVEGVQLASVNVNLTLPLFNRNRGQIAIQRATRELLRQTYQSQLDAAASQAGQVWAAIQIMSRQLRDLQAQIPELEAAAHAAQNGLRRGELNAGLYVNLETSLLAREVDVLRLGASINQATSQLNALLGLPF